MADQFVGEIRMFGCNFAPTGWAQCNGQLLPISQNTALFSLLGTYYGGDGKSTFALPNLQGSLASHHGQGPALSETFIGEERGSESVTLLLSEIPLHNHPIVARAGAGTTSAAANNYPAHGSWVQGAQFGVVQTYSTSAPNAQMNPQTLAIAGGSLPHNNMMPYQVINYCIALQGIFPQRG